MMKKSYYTYKTDATGVGFRKISTGRDCMNYVPDKKIPRPKAFASKSLVNTQGDTATLKEKHLEHHMGYKSLIITALPER